MPGLGNGQTWLDKELGPAAAYTLCIEDTRNQVCLDAGVVPLVIEHAMSGSNNMCSLAHIKAGSVIRQQNTATLVFFVQAT